MNDIAARPPVGASRSSTATAAGPCSATSARSVAPGQPHRWRKARFEQRKINGFARGVDDQVELAVSARRPRDHQVVDDSALGVEQLAVALAARREAKKVRRTESLERGGDGRVVGPDELRLAHVRDVEQAGAGAGMEMFGEDAGGILNRHVVAGERPHPRAEFDMQRMKRRAQRRGIGHGITPVAIRRAATARRIRRVGPRGAPSVSRPERFPAATRRLPPSVGGRAAGACHFPERHHPTVHWPERFRGGCAFGAGG